METTGKILATFDLCVVFTLVMLIVFPLVGLRLLDRWNVKRGDWGYYVWYGATLLVLGLAWAATRWVIDWVWRL